MKSNVRSKLTAHFRFKSHSLTLKCSNSKDYVVAYNTIDHKARANLMEIKYINQITRSQDIKGCELVYHFCNLNLDFQILIAFKNDGFSSG